MKLAELLKKNKIAVVLILLCIVGAILLTAGGNKKTSSELSNEEYVKQLENKIEHMVSVICGGKAEVIVTLECGVESEYARDYSSDIDKTSGSSSEKEEYVVMSGKTPLVIKVTEPKIRGIAIACTGGDSATLQLKIIKALSCAYGISSGKVCVVALG